MGSASMPLGISINPFAFGISERVC